MMRVPQAVLVGASEVCRAEALALSPVKVAKGMLPLPENIELWRIVPRDGASLALVLPFPGSSGITVANVGRRFSTGTDEEREEARAEMRQRAAREARLILCGNVLMSYMTAWGLWARDPDSAGRFLVNPARVAELRGFERDRVGSYGRPMVNFKRDLADLNNCCVSGTDEIKARQPEPLIQRYEVARGGVYYGHPRVLIDTIRLKAGEAGGFAQVPMQAMRLGTHDGPLIVGLAAFWRPFAADCVWSGSLESLAERLGILRDTKRRSMGRSYWRLTSDKIARVARDGGFGHLFVEGGDPSGQTTVVLTPSNELKDAYQPLRERREDRRARAQAASEEAAVRRLLPQPRRKNRKK
jgi:hypothetical protein